MVEIGINEKDREIKIKIKIWALAQIKDNDDWLKVIADECKRLIDHQIEKDIQKIKEKEKK